MSARWTWKLWQSGMVVAQGDCPDEATARTEGTRYAFQYAEEGKVILRVRKARSAPTPSPAMGG
jgi:hypothetical protein